MTLRVPPRSVKEGTKGVWYYSLQCGNPLPDLPSIFNSTFPKGTQPSNLSTPTLFCMKILKLCLHDASNSNYAFQHKLTQKVILTTIQLRVRMLHYERKANSFRHILT